jgi:GDP-4-dehydro-6-deoxy-D-mannose reductase
VPGARILFISSSDVYGILTPRKKAFREGERSGVVSPYAFTKVSGELLAEFYAQIEKQDVVIARPFPHTGPGQGPDFVCADWARQIALIEKKQKIKGRNSRSFPAPSSVIEVGNLTTQRDYSDVRDVVRAYELLLQKGKPKEVYNVCSGRAIPLKKILDTLLAFSVCQIRVRVDPSKLRKSDIPYLAGNNRKIRIETGWKPQIPIQQTLRDLLEYWRKKI